jgi:hypothetical protein
MIRALAAARAASHAGRVNPNLLVGLLLGVCATAIWGVHAVISRAAILEGFQPLDILALRHTAAAVALAPFAWKARRAIAAVGRKRLVVLAIAGGVPTACSTARRWSGRRPTTPAPSRRSPSPSSAR